MTVRDRVRQYISEACYVSDLTILSDDLSLLDSGVVDSTGMMDIIVFLETEYGIQIGDQDTTPDNLETIARIAAFVSRKQSSGVSRVGPGEAG